MDAIGPQTLKYLVVGGSSAVAFTMWHGAKGASIAIPFLKDVQAPVWAIGAALGVGSSMVTDMARAWLLPHLSADNSVKTIEGAALQVGGGSLAYVAFAHLINPNLVTEAGLYPLMIKGAALNLFAEKMFEDVASPLVMGKQGDW